MANGMNINSPEQLDPTLKNGKRKSPTDLGGDAGPGGFVVNNPEATILKEAEEARRKTLAERRKRELSSGGNQFASALSLFNQVNPVQLTSILGRINGTR